MTPITRQRVSELVEKGQYADAILTAQRDVTGYWHDEITYSTRSLINKVVSMIVSREKALARVNHLVGGDADGIIRK